MSFCALQVSFERIYYTFAEESGKLFWTRLKERAFALVGKGLEHLQIREFLCVQRPRALIVSAGPRNKTLREWIQCFYNIVIDRLFEATSQSKNDRREQTLQLRTNQLALIRYPTVH